MRAKRKMHAVEMIQYLQRRERLMGYPYRSVLRERAIRFKLTVRRRKGHA